MYDLSINFCKNLRYLRQEHCLTKKAMAEILGVSVSTYRKIEQCDGSVRLHSGMLLRIIDHFQIPADDLLLSELSCPDHALRYGADGSV